MTYSNSGAWVAEARYTLMPFPRFPSLVWGWVCSHRRSLGSGISLLEKYIYSTFTGLLIYKIGVSRQHLELGIQPPLWLCLVNIRLRQLPWQRERVSAADLCDQQCSRVVGLQLDIDLAIKAPEFPVGPHIADLVSAAFFEPWDVAKVGRLGGHLI